jgi:ERCC4-related helicase
MIIDNKTQTQLRGGKTVTSIADFITDNLRDGEIDIVSGYFTIGALSFIANLVNNKATAFRFILGDIVKKESELNALDLLNQNVSIEDALKLCKTAEKAVAFLKLKSIELKTLEPNFCHAKLYIHRAKTDYVENDSFFIIGSSNLTEAGIGLKQGSNLELNIANRSIDNDFTDVENWFNNLWNSPEAREKITLPDGSKKDFKTYLIEEISRIFLPYTPEQIYFKILSELFADDINLAEGEKRIAHLKDTIIWNKLFDYQKVGVQSLLRNLENYDGAILADAVGLGKTWTALTVMKSYQMKGYTSILIGPKKLRQNWEQYKKNKSAVFEDDKLDFDYVNHTSLTDNLLERDLDMSLDFLYNDKPKLIIIDESHNLRNRKSTRYEFLVREILQKIKGDVKVLLLSATPINNSFNDIRDQFALIALGLDNGFQESMEIKSLNSTFKSVNQSFKKWRESPNALPLSYLFNEIKDSDFFELTQKLLVARTRKNIKEFFDANLILPEHKPVINRYKTPIEFNPDIRTMEDLLERMDVGLMAYQPSYYTLSKEERELIEKEKQERQEKNQKADKDAVLQDNVQREYFLVKMMKILMVKRLESSWDSFYKTILVFRNHHQALIEKLNQFKENTNVDANFELLDENEAKSLEDWIDDDPNLDEFVGKKNPISIKKIFLAGNLNDFMNDVEEDLQKLNSLLTNLESFKTLIDHETSSSSNDSKLEDLMALILEKQKTENKKVIIFTVYNDTAQYLYSELNKRGFTNLGLVSGSQFINHNGDFIRSMDEILERFAPYTKLFNEKNWGDFERAKDVKSKNLESFLLWKNWIKDEQPKTYEKLTSPIDILIATDVLSEGQNLQDADMVVNYDIHWNPVRVIQRVGRIDRIGSPNIKIQAVNYWPTASVDEYINLQKRVKDRMAAMKLAGSEIVNIDEEFKNSTEVEELDATQNSSIISQIEKSFENADAENTLGFDDFSFENYRQLVEDKLKSDLNKNYKDLPDGIFSGFLHAEIKEEGMIALLRSSFKHKKTGELIQRHTLAFINQQGKTLATNQKTILDFLSLYYKKDRHLSEDLEQGNPQVMQAWKEALYTYIESVVVQKEVNEDGEEVSYASVNQTNDFLNIGNAKTKEKIESGEFSYQHYQPENQSLLAWMIVTNKN